MFDLYRAEDFISATEFLLKLKKNNMSEIFNSIKVSPEVKEQVDTIFQMKKPALIDIQVIEDLIEEYKRKSEILYKRNHDGFARDFDCKVSIMTYLLEKLITPITYGD